MIRWDMLQPVDIGARVMQGYQLGSEMVRKERLNGALAAYAENPNDPGVRSALAHLSPQFAYQLGNERRQAAEKARLGSYFASPDKKAAAQDAYAHGEIDIGKRLEQFGAEEAKQHAEALKYAAPIAYQAAKLPYEQRKTYLESVKPQMLANGWTEDSFSRLDPTDQNLAAMVTSAQTLQQAMEADEIKWVVPTDRDAFAVNSMGRVVQVGGSAQPTATAQTEGAAGNLSRYDDPGYSAIEAPLEAELGLPAGLIGRIRTRGERSNADQVSSAGAKTVYQIIPQTRDLFLKKYGVDAYASPQNAARVAALHLKESIDRGEDPVRGYIGGPDTSNWGPQTQAYAARVNGSQNADTVRQQARAAIAAGADPEAVRAKAAEMGVTL